METRLEEIFRLLDDESRGECSFRRLLAFGDFIGVEWTLLYLREAFNYFDATNDTIINLSQFLRFTVNELNGLDLQLFNYVVEGFIVFTGFDARIQDELQNCFVSMPSYKVFTVSISDCLYLAEYLSPEKDRPYHLHVLSVIDVTAVVNVKNRIREMGTLASTSSLLSWRSSFLSPLRPTSWHVGYRCT
ncbi:hypothetical protein WA538_002559 [Blastocystis sp. DL]